ncbi:MAG TPA: type II toxin-antitoxin system VapB family antitoxin [Allosphingosinicella sp.]
MRTTIAIDDDLLREALSATGAKTKREVVELGLNTLVRLKRQEQLRKLRGAGWDGNLDAMRADD